MASTPKLSICIPSRNRQIYLQSAIQGVLRTQRTDVEFVFADNSDDPSIMNRFMENITDSRVKYLPTEDNILSMVDNWERTVTATTGDWVVVVGDDDYMDPDAAALILRLEAVRPDADVIGWTPLYYPWPDGQPPLTNLIIPLENKVVNVPREILLGRILSWNDTTSGIPVSGMTIYHHAVRRSLLEKIRSTYGRFFENPIVDYDNAIKNIVHGRVFLTCQRAYSVMGACPESNTYSLSRLADMRKKVRAFGDDLGRDPNGEEGLDSFPFRMEQGVTATIGQTIHWYKTKYGLRYGKWERNFVRACARNVEYFRNREDFDLVRDAYQRSIDVWHGGKFKDDFKPVFQGDIPLTRVTGFSEDRVYIDYDTPGIDSAASFHDFACDVMTLTDEIEGDGVTFSFPAKAG